MRLATPVLVLFAACGYHVYSPPGRVLPLESAATLARGRTAIGGEISGHGGGGVDTIPGGSLRVRRGVSDNLEGSVEASIASIDGDSAAGTDPKLYQFFAGMKWNPGTRFLGLVAGVGGGGSAAGSFGAVDVGVIAAYENCYVVPFLGVHGILSVPLEAKDVDVTKTGDMTQHIDRPATTGGFSIRGGVKIAMGHETCAEPERVDLFAGIEAMQLAKDGGHDGFIGVGIGAQVSF